VCKHWSGRDALFNRTCAAGVDFGALDGDVKPGLFRRVPCMTANAEPSFSCALRDLPTAEEVERSDAEFKVLVDAVVAVMEAIGKQPKGGSGTVPCPKCGGTIHWRASSYNGHRHAACETPDCLQVME
jgi:hypothetical protein